MICPNGDIHPNVAASLFRGKGHRAALPQEEHSPQTDQDEVAHCEHRQPMEDVVVGYVNECLRHAKCDICPAHFENDRVSAIRHIEHQANHIEQNWQSPGTLPDSPYLKSSELTFPAKAARKR
jgi:hypothetical protein